MAKLTEVVGAGATPDAFIKAEALDVSNLLQYKLSGLFNAGFLRMYQSLYGSEETKELVLRKLKCVDLFDDVEVVLDWTTYTEDGVATDLAGANDTYSITKSEDYLTITITTDDTAGHRGVAVYKNFATAPASVWVSVIFVQGPTTNHICLCNGDVSVWTVDRYNVLINVPASTSDFKLAKIIGGTYTELAAESVDLSAGGEYKVAMFVDGNRNKLTAWREVDPVNYSSYTLQASDSDITSFTAYRLGMDTQNTSVTETYRFKAPFILAWRY